MRVLPLLLVLSLIVVAGCGTYEERSGGGPASTEGSTDSGPPQPPGDDALNTTPPVIMLRSEAGAQEAVAGASCVSVTDESESPGGSVTGCSFAGPMEAARLSTVRPGEEVAIFLVDASFERAEGCFSDTERQDCAGIAHVLPLGCERREVARITLVPGEATRWRVDLEPGAYELDVSAYFHASDGRGGDASGSLGLLVDETAPLEIVPRPDSVPGCTTD